MRKLVNRAEMTVAGAPGTGAITLASATARGQSFAGAGVADGDTIAYVIESLDGSQWEIHEDAIYSASPPHLPRSGLVASSAAGAPVSFAADAIVYIDAVASDFYARLATANNLSDLANAATARTNLGLGALATLAPGMGVAAALAVALNTAGGLAAYSVLGSAAFQNSSAFLLASSNLSDLSNTAIARTNLGLGALSTVTPGAGVAAALGVNIGTAGAVVVMGGALGTPASGALTNATGLPIGTGLTGAGAGVLAALAVNVGSAGSVVLNGGALGTPSSGTLSNATGLPVSTGLTGLGAGVSTFLATPSSANLAGAVTDETGSGALVFATSPTLVTPVLGVASATSVALNANVTLYGDAANALALRNGSNSQTLLVYNVYTDSLNYERLELGFVSNEARLSSAAAGTGTVRNLRMKVGAKSAFYFNAPANNIALGGPDLAAVTTGYQNVAVGYLTMLSLTSGYNNVGLGFYSLPALTTGAANFGLGAYALQTLTIGSFNVGLGYLAGSGIVGGVANIAIGSSTMSTAMSGSYAIAIGYGAMGYFTGNYSVGIGFSALAASTSGVNVAVGGSAGQDVTSGSMNVFFGYASGRGIATGSNNTILGAQVTGLPATLSGAVILATGDGNIRADYNNTNANAWTFAGPVSPKGYTVAALPTGVEGQRAYATNGRKSGEGAGAGTGVPVYFSNGAWRRHYDDGAVTA